MVVALAGSMAPACSDDSCVEVDVASCTPTYDPTFDNLFSRTLGPSCGVTGGACHGAEGAKGGLILEIADEAYTLLLDGRVEPGDPGCSLLVQRIESTDGSVKMPPGSRTLAAGDRCAIERWIADGAAR